MANGGSIEIVSVNAANIYDTESDLSEDDDIGPAYIQDEHGNLIEIDTRSQCSNQTFRSRTDSSSIGDYESHSSDYEDETEGDAEEEEQEQEAEEEFISLPKIQNSQLSIQSKERTFSCTTIGSDVDALGLNIDANNFDLAEFITKDDFTLNTSNNLQHCINNNNNIDYNKSLITPLNDSTAAVVVASIHNSPVQIISNEADSDSDVIVDVETVEVEDEDNSKDSKSSASMVWSKSNQAKQDAVASFVDNVKKDPSWSPQQCLSKKQEVTF